MFRPFLPRWTSDVSLPDWMQIKRHQLPELHLGGSGNFGLVYVEFPAGVKSPVSWNRHRSAYSSYVVPEPIACPENLALIGFVDPWHGVGRVLAV